MAPKYEWFVTDTNNTQWSFIIRDCPNLKQSLIISQLLFPIRYYSILVIADDYLLETLFL